MVLVVGKGQKFLIHLEKKNQFLIPFLFNFYYQKKMMKTILVVCDFYITNCYGLYYNINTRNF